MAPSMIGRRLLSRLLTTTKGRVLLIWNWAALRFEGDKHSSIASQHAVFLAVGIVIVLLLLIFSGGTAAVAAVAAWIALMRHFAQTDADRQRRISESYSRGVEQLSSEKMEVRLGGIYTLEHVSRESRDDYWTVMETIAAFLRERARRAGKKPTGCFRFCHQISSRGTLVSGGNPGAKAVRRTKNSKEAGCSFALFRCSSCGSHRASR
jgi:hypothetical protein